MTRLEGAQAVATLSFTGEAAEAGQALMSELPSGLKPSGAVGLFPCFTRGVNTCVATVTP